ncbi:hypothetical protein BDB00DRAFT_794938 [Zychaea mexicana]|uniref:uncharacterized protein n=1 Tax=Zychaea mexicana TaxID=64656 RepID=UPI0022FE5798|nr:uncharacterized protein BDB00DRAFT_794938 [Zychaea mexicana]KAI9499641.1 hypothetical protein BDB00DRAFT_794938 [Zychaea mexicana]
MQDIHDQSGLSMYTTDFFLMDLTDPAAAAAVAATTSAASEQNIYQPRIPDRTSLRNEAPSTPEPFSSTVMNSTSSTVAVTAASAGSNNNSGGCGMVNNITSRAPKVTLLPAPQPNLTSNKSWTQSRQKDWNIDFQPSIIETLHQNTHMSIEPASFGTANIVDPSSMSINIDPMTSHTTAQQPNLNDNSNVLLFFNTMNSQQQHRLSQQQQQQQHQGGGNGGSSGWYAASPSSRTHASSLTRMHHTQRPPGIYTDGSRRQRHQKRTRSPRSSSSLDQQPSPSSHHHHHHPPPPSLSEPTNSSASDGRSTSASPAMFNQDQWINVSQNKVPTDVLTSWP